MGVMQNAKAWLEVEWGVMTVWPLFIEGQKRTEKKKYLYVGTNNSDTIE